MFDSDADFGQLHVAGCIVDVESVRSMGESGWKLIICCPEEENEVCLENWNNY